MTLAAANAFSEEIAITGDGSNHSGVWGGAPSRRRPTGVEGRGPQRCGDFPVFFIKIKHFYAYFGLDFLLRNLFLNDYALCC